MSGKSREITGEARKEDANVGEEGGERRRLEWMKNEGRHSFDTERKWGEGEGREIRQVQG